MCWPVRLAVVFLLLRGAEFPANSQFSGPSLAALKARAEAGDAAAQEQLAEQFSQHRDFQAAESWYRKSAEQGFAPAQGKLAKFLLPRTVPRMGTTSEERAEAGDEALKWLMLAANQGDKQAQADLADLYFEGRLVTTDLIEAYKWADLATQGATPYSAANISGRSTRDAAILKMTAQELAEAKKRVANFRPRLLGKNELPEPAWVKQIKLTALVGPPNRRLALVGGTPFSNGETALVKIGGQSKKIRCLEIRDNSALVEIEGFETPRELLLAPNPK